jgi:hypothetical protein
MQAQIRILEQQVSSATIWRFFSPDDSVTVHLNVHGYGRVLFGSEHQRAEAYFRETAQIAQQIFVLKKDPLSLDAVSQFLSLYYLQHHPPDGPRWDTKNISGDYRLKQDRKLPFQFQFRSVADKFRFIESEQVAVLIPFDEKANVLLDELRNEAIPLHRSLLRGLQLYTVQVYRSKFLRNHAQFESVRDQQFHILIYPETQYSSRFGLHLDSGPNHPLFVKMPYGIILEISGDYALFRRIDKGRSRGENVRCPIRCLPTLASGPQAARLTKNRSGGKRLIAS